MKEMPSINVKYFALLKEKAGIDSEVLDFEGSHAELYQILSSKYSFSLPSEMVQVAANDEFVSMSSLVTEHSKIVFIPPVAGG
jgi:sulfur-carrier protein